MFTSKYLKVIGLSHYSGPKFHSNDFLSGCFLRNKILFKFYLYVSRV